MEAFFSLAAMAVVASGTPGPNNIMLMASGARFGVMRSWPHMIGVWIGFISILVLVGFGFGVVVERYPIAHEVFRYVAIGFILYIAWKIARAGPIEAETEGAIRPMRVHEAALFQIVNPKTWSMILAVVALYTTASGNRVGEVAWIVAMFSIFGFPCSFAWCLVGRLLARFFRSPRIATLANGTMAALLVLTVVPMLI